MDQLRAWVETQLPRLVRQAQEGNGILRSDLAAELGIRRQSLALKLAGDRKFSAVEVIYLTRKFNIDIPGGTQCQ